MELIEYIRLFRKWWWLFIIAALLASGIAYLTRSRAPVIYQARVMLSVGGYIQSPNPNTSQINAGEQLAETYAVLAKTYDVMEAAIEAGDFSLTPEDLQETITTRVITGTSLLQLSVEHFDPVLVVELANEVAQQLMLNSPSNLTPEQQAQVDLANAEIELLAAQLQDLREERQLVEQLLTDPVDEFQELQLQERRRELFSQINQASSNLAGFSSTVAQLQSRSNSIDIMERARTALPANEIGVLSATLMGAMIGLTLAGGTVLLIEYFDDTLKTAETAAQTLKVPILGVIAKFGKSRTDYNQQLIVYTDPSSPVAEAYRALRTNLVFAAERNKHKVYVITSPGPEEGKSVTTANLAVAMAAAGMRVLLIDADLRRPKQHHFFNLPNRLGLTTLLSAEPLNGEDLPEEALRLSNDCRQCIQDTVIPRLKVITSGFIPSNPTETLGTVIMQRWVERFRSSEQIDIVLFDSPPALVVSDSAVLAVATNAAVVLVLDAGKTHRKAALRAKEQFLQLELEVTGAVLNQIDMRDLSHDYGYNYYYYSEESTSKGRNSRLGSN